MLQAFDFAPPVIFLPPPSAPSWLRANPNRLWLRWNSACFSQPGGAESVCFLMCSSLGAVRSWLRLIQISCKPKGSVQGGAKCRGCATSGCWSGVRGLNWGAKGWIHPALLSLCGWSCADPRVKAFLNKCRVYRECRSDAADGELP